MENDDKVKMDLMAAAMKLDQMEVPDDGRTLAEDPILKPMVSTQPGHMFTRTHKHVGEHVIMTVGIESYRIGFRSTRAHILTRNKYTPHYGKQAAARNLARMSA